MQSTTTWSTTTQSLCVCVTLDDVVPNDDGSSNVCSIRKGMVDYRLVVSTTQPKVEGDDEEEKEK